MNLIQVKSALENAQTLGFELPDGTTVPSHFHVTEIGVTQKTFIDCGGKLRKEEKVNFQLWSSDDYDHRLHPEKLLKIIAIAEKNLPIDSESEIEVEYQGRSIEKYGLDFNGNSFQLTTTHTDCLAKENCGIPAEKPKRNLAALQTDGCCVSDGKCC